MHRELSSRAFTDALLKLANDRNTHQQVKGKILERMREWADMFSKDEDLGIMHEAYHRLKQTNPQLQPPSAPKKSILTDVDRQKEEDELQMALKLSLQEEERKKKATAPPASGAAGWSSGAAGASAAAAPSAPVPTGTTAATVSRVRALFDFVPSEPGELEFKKGDVIAVMASAYKDWWHGSLKGKTGIFPPQLRREAHRPHARRAAARGPDGGRGLRRDQERREAADPSEHLQHGPEGGRQRGDLGTACFRALPPHSRGAQAD